jgi:inward rectifier potassium channel
MQSKRRQGSRVAKRPGRARLMIDGRPLATVHGIRTRTWRDPYHFLLTVSWPVFLTLAFVAYLAVNAGFALLYALDLQGITNARPGSFWDAFFFSVQTSGTIGYGVLAPHSFYVNVITAIESFFGLVGFALLTGIIFARFAKPTARILFSRPAVVSEFEGVPTLMIRAANERGNQILEAEVSLNLVHNTRTKEGASIRRFEELGVLRSRSPLFALSWTVLHPIDDNSPLHGLDAAELQRRSAELAVTISGIDQVFAQKIYARHSYAARDILWNHRFADILCLQSDGTRIVDYGRFHDVEPVEAPSSPVGK